ncbi:MAG: hypothetical protein FNT29_07450 [Halothiobacillaceae bacterium]|jgi:hypothetical protein|nr:MAG: hypothetical protein FNT29_07450 [Halothiobacillaceae bacterium]
MNRALSLLAGLGLAVLLTACSGKPSINELQRLVAADLGATGPQAIVRVENFSKDNGYAKDDRRYVAEVSYDLVFQKGLQDVAVQAQNAPGGPLEKMGKGMGLMTLGLLYGDFKAGDRLPQKKKVTLIRTENGWRIEEE